MHIIEQDCDGYLIFKYANVYDGAGQKIQFTQVLLVWNTFTLCSDW